MKTLEMNLISVIWSEQFTLYIPAHSLTVQTNHNFSYQFGSALLEDKPGDGVQSYHFDWLYG